ncbi:unnamed protein product, partial [Amoebophrya sp. A25]|eukprot:GSA25T00006312001.1
MLNMIMLMPLLIFILGCVLVWSLENKKAVAVRAMMADQIEEYIAKIKLMVIEGHPKWLYRFLKYHLAYCEKWLDRWWAIYGRRLYMRMTRTGRRFWYGLAVVAEQEA